MDGTFLSIHACGNGTLVIGCSVKKHDSADPYVKHERDLSSSLSNMYFSVDEILFDENLRQLMVPLYPFKGRFHIRCDAERGVVGVLRIPGVVEYKIEDKAGTVWHSIDRIKINPFTNTVAIVGNIPFLLSAVVLDPLKVELGPAPDSGL